MSGSIFLNTPVTIEVNYESGLYVGLIIYDDSGLTPVQLLPVGNINGVMPMLNVTDTLYRAKYTPLSVGTLLFRKAVYTDGTYTTLHPDYSRASEALQVDTLNISYVNRTVEFDMTADTIDTILTIESIQTKLEVEIESNK
jgi:hypothetical protein